MKMGIVAAVLVILGAGASALAADQSSEYQMKGQSYSSEARAVRRIIPQYGFIASNYQGGGAGNYNNNDGYTAGALTDIGTDPHLVLETGFLFRELNGGTQNTAGTAAFTSNYLSLPVAAKYYFSGQDRTSLYGKLGLMESYMTAQNLGYTGTYANVSGALQSNYWETSGVAGVGGKVAINDQADLVLEVSYLQAFNALFSNADVYNAAWSFTAGLSFNM